MPVGAGSIKRAARTAVIGNPENLEKAAVLAEGAAGGEETAVKEQASVSPEEKAAEEKAAKETSAKKKAPARKNAAKTGAAKRTEKASAKKSAAKQEAPKNVKAEPEEKDGVDREAGRQKTYGINDELPVYLM